MLFNILFVFEGFGDHRDLPVLTHSFPTRRSSDLAEALGRFAYAIIVVEFAAQIATLGLKRGLAEQLSTDGRPDTHVVWDALLVGWIVSAIAAVEIGRASCRERVCQYV